MNRIKLILVSVFVCNILLGVVVYAAYERVKPIRNVGTIRAIGVEIYGDEELTSVLNEIT